MAEQTTLLAGRVLRRGGAAYEEARQAAVWNARKPDRFPDAIVVTRSEHDVVAAVRYAREKELKIAVRAGGHSWCGSPVRDSGLLIDVHQLREIRVDAAARVASVQPGVTGLDFITELGRHGLAFPVGHCPSVPLSGFLLSGGLGWNSGEWGPACASVYRIEVVTPSGDLVIADEEQHVELFWAARGGGPGFTGVVTRFHVKLHELPKAILSSTCLYPLGETEAVARWAEEIIPTLPRRVEATMCFRTLPSGAKALAIIGTTFAQSERQALDDLSALASCPSLARALERNLCEPTPLPVLLASLDGAFPPGHRYAAEAMWSREDYPRLLPLLARQFERAPSPNALLEAVPFLPPPGDGGDMAFSMLGRTLILPYAIWDSEAGDEVNQAWSRDVVESMRTYVHGYYVAEANLARGDATVSERSFSLSRWTRLEQVRSKYDPDRAFHHFLDR